MLKTIMESSLRFFGLTGGGMQGIYGEILDMGFGVTKVDGVSHNEQVIVMSTFIRDSLESVEFEAIKLHEFGHYVLKHEARAAAAGCPAAANTVQIRQAFELEADAYAAERVGSNVMARALRRIPEITTTHPDIVDYLRQKLNLGEAELAAVLADSYSEAIKSLQYRLDALE